MTTFRKKYQKKTKKKTKNRIGLFYFFSNWNESNQFEGLSIGVHERETTSCGGTTYNTPRVITGTWQWRMTMRRKKLGGTTTSNTKKGYIQYTPASGLLSYTVWYRLWMQLAQVHRQFFVTTLCIYDDDDDRCRRASYIRKKGNQLGASDPHSKFLCNFGFLLRWNCCSICRRRRTAIFFSLVVQFDCFLPPRSCKGKKTYM